MQSIMHHNSLRLSGTVLAEPQFSHSDHGCAIFSFPLGVARASGVEDVLPVLGSEQHMPPCGALRVSVNGQLRAYNRPPGESPRVRIAAFARDIVPAGTAEDENCVELVGSLCRRPVLRSTPLGRQVADMLLAVNRAYGRTDYLPVIAWGMNARRAAQMETGDLLHVTGRLQSRAYQKMLAGGETVTRTAYELSAFGMERL